MKIQTGYFNGSVEKKTVVLYKKKQDSKGKCVYNEIGS